MSIEWGSVGEWVGGVGSALAASTAVWLAATRFSRERRDQAKRVILIVRTLDHYDEWPRALQAWEEQVLSDRRSPTGPELIVVENGSDGAILDVSVPAEPGWIPGSDHNGDMVMVRPTVASWESLGVGQRVRDMTIAHPMACVEFSDRHGTRWRRGKGDSLLEVTSKRVRFESGEMPKFYSFFYRRWLKLRGQPLY